MKWSHNNYSKFRAYTYVYIVTILREYSFEQGRHMQKYYVAKLYENVVLDIKNIFIKYNWICRIVYKCCG